MRNLFVLACVFIFALSGAALAANVSWSGEFKADGKWSSGAILPEDATLFGKYSMESSAKVRIELEDEDEVWDASIDLGGAFGAAPTLGRYIVKINEDAFTGTVWGKYGKTNIGHKGDPFVFIRINGINDDFAPAIRVAGEFDDFTLTAQVPAEGHQFAANVETTAGDLSLGGTLEHNLYQDAPSQAAFNRLSLYGGLEAGIVEFDAAFALTTKHDDENAAVGLAVSADVTEQLNLSGEYRTVGKNYAGASSGFDLEATYTDGLLRLTADHGINTDVDTSESSLGVIYRGSDDNKPFADLFKDDHYTSNVAFAFGGAYTVGNAPGEAASTVAFNATGPILPDTFWFNSNLTMSQNNDRFQHEDYYDSVRSYTGVTLDGHALVTAKLTLEPHVASKQWADVVHDDDDLGLLTGNASSLTLELGATYALTDDVSLRSELGQTSKGGTGDFSAATVDRFSSFGVTVKF